jgi:AcrR family transcriptional regulator
MATKTPRSSQPDPKQSAQPTARQQQATLRREQILEQSLRLFAQHGFSGTSTKMIAQAVGITEGLIFHYFPDKFSILATILEKRELVLNDVLRLLERSKDRPAKELLPEIALRSAAVQRRESDYVRLLIGSNAQDGNQFGGLSAAISGFASRLAVYLESRVEAGELRTGMNTQIAAFTFLAPTIMFFMSNYGLSDSEWQARCEVFIREHFEIWYTGVRTP